MRRPDPYPLHRQFVAPAWARPSLWLVLLVVIGFEVSFEAMPYLIYPDETLTDSGRIRVGPFDTIRELAAFAIPATALIVLVRFLHNRGLQSLLGPRDATRRDLIRATLLVSVVILLQEPVRIWLEWDLLERSRPIDQWALVLPLGIAALLVQVGTEEIYFRGYLQQQLAVKSPSPWVWMALPSLFFGMAHFVNGSTAQEGLLWMIWATALGVACADLTARSGNLGAAIGLHLANNIFALAFTAVEDWNMSGLALWLYPYVEPFSYGPQPWGAALIGLCISLVEIWVMWLAARIAIRR